MLKARFFLVACEVFDLAGAVLIAEYEKPPADQSLDAPLPAKRYLAQRADLAVRDVKILAIGGQAARLGEVRERQWSVADVLASATGIRADFLALQVECPNLVVAGHRD